MSDHNFNTPPDFLDDYVRPLGVIGLDPCSNEHAMTAAVTSYDVVTNGLAHSWRGHGLVFMNPPHSHSPNNIEPWMVRFAQQFEVVENDDQFVGLVPAKTDTAWFHECAVLADRRCFLRGRLKFWLAGVDTQSTGKFANMVFYRGRQVELFDDLFAPLGWLA